jgi:hypothetical protein
MPVEVCEALPVLKLSGARWRGMCLRRRGARLAMALATFLIFVVPGCSADASRASGVYVIADYVPPGFRVVRSLDGGLRFDYSYTDDPFGVEVRDCMTDPIDDCGRIAGQSVAVVDGREVRTGPVPGGDFVPHDYMGYFAYVNDGGYLLQVNSDVANQDEGVRIALGLHVVDPNAWHKWADSLGYDPNDRKCCDIPRLIQVTFVNDTPDERFISYCWRADCEDHFFGYHQLMPGDRLTRQLVSVPGPVGRYIVYRGELSDETSTIVGCLAANQSARPGSSTELRLSSAGACT